MGTRQITMMENYPPCVAVPHRVGGLLTCDIMFVGLWTTLLRILLVHVAVFDLTTIFHLGFGCVQCIDERVTMMFQVCRKVAGPGSTERTTLGESFGPEGRLSPNSGSLWDSGAL